MDFSITRKKQQLLAERMKACGLKEQDLEEKFVRSSGPGGQNVNKTATCVQLKHIPTGLEVKSQSERSQPLNRYYARKRMCELLEEKLFSKAAPKLLQQEKLRKQKQRRKRRSRKKDVQES